MSVHCISLCFEQVGSRGGPEEVLEFSKRTAAQVKGILAQGQVGAEQKLKNRDNAKSLQEIC